jgi:hypothetical protein
MAPANEPNPVAGRVDVPCPVGNQLSEKGHHGR